MTPSETWTETETVINNSTAVKNGEVYLRRDGVYLAVRSDEIEAKYVKTSTQNCYNLLDLEFSESSYWIKIFAFDNRDNIYSKVRTWYVMGICECLQKCSNKEHFMYIEGVMYDSTVEITGFMECK